MDAAQAMSALEGLYKRLTGHYSQASKDLAAAQESGDGFAEQQAKSRRATLADELAALDLALDRLRRAS